MYRYKNIWTSYMYIPISRGEQICQTNAKHKTWNTKKFSLHVVTFRFCCCSILLPQLPFFDVFSLKKDLLQYLDPKVMSNVKYLIDNNMISLRENYIFSKKRLNGTEFLIEKQILSRLYQISNLNHFDSMSKQSTTFLSQINFSMILNLYFFARTKTCI